MCGHVGVVSTNILRKHVDYFSQGLYIDALRGQHGTGVAMIGKDKSISLKKKAMTAIDFLDLNSVDRLITSRSLNVNFLMGHNRHATKGSIIHKNSHPFNIKHITLAHNGSLISQLDLPDHAQFPVDSENICHSIAEIGVDETVKKLNGSYSLVWYDAAANTVNFIRNEERPMWFGFTDSNKTLLYASEEGMLRWLADRNGHTLETVYQTREGVLYSFSLEALEMSPTIRKLEMYSRPVYNNYNYGNTNRPKWNTTETVEAKLKEIGLQKGEEVEFTVTEIHQLRNQVHPVIVGVLFDSNFSDAVAFNAKVPSNVKYGDCFKATVTSFTSSENKSFPNMVVLDPFSFKEINFGETKTGGEDDATKKDL